MNNLFENKKTLQGLIIAGVICLCIFFLANAKGALYSESKDKPIATISVSGDGEYLTTPDRASFTVTVEKESPTRVGAKDAGAVVINKIIDSLKKDYSMTDKDLKTINLSVSPKYQYAPACYGGYCPPSNPKIIGFTFNQTITVKVKDLDKADEVFSKLTEWGASTVSGPDFTLSDEDQPKSMARTEAINKAKVKAEELAKQLGVKLGKIQSFSESNGGGIYPMAYDSMNARGAMMEKSIAPQIPTGENKYTSNVNIVYEIK